MARLLVFERINDHAGGLDHSNLYTSENLTENSLAKVLSNLQSSWLCRKLKASVQSKVTDFFK